MNLGVVLHLLGRLCTVVAALLLAPLAICWIDGTLGGIEAKACLGSAAIALAAGGALRLAFRFRADELGRREAFAVVAGAWLVFTALGALPYLLTGRIPRVVDAVFETMSGAATCGASILPDPGVLGRPLLFWRGLTIFVGGLGIVALSVAILPALGAGGNLLFQGEAVGPEKGKLLPRVSSMSRVLWGTYATLTVFTVSLFVLTGQAPFEAVVHGFATVGTGGFGTRPDSFASLPVATQWAAVLCMTLSGTNFVLLLALLRGRGQDLWRDLEWRTYVAILGGAVALSALVRLGAEGLPGDWEAFLRDCAFSVVSVGSTTGFATADFDAWPAALHVLFFGLMFCGACAGSTSGSTKVARLILYAKAAGREVRRLLRPTAVVAVRVGARAIPDDVVRRSLLFLALFLAAWFAGAVVLMLTGLGAETSFSAVLTCLAGVGPGFDAVGPTCNFAGLSDAAKWTLVAAMMLGRLEFFALLVLLSPQAWRR